MGCGCVSQRQVASSSVGPRVFLHTSDADFVRALPPVERKDKRRLLAFKHSLDEHGQFRVTQDFRTLVRQEGVPARYRWQVWRSLSGAGEGFRRGDYERCAKNGTDPRVFAAIEKDLNRTFPQLEEFDESKKKELARMMCGYANLYPTVGYCQGMNFIAGFLLLAAGEHGISAEDAFFLFVRIMAKYQASLLFCEGLPLLKLYTFQFGRMMQQHFPEVHRHFHQNSITPELYVTKWILTVFTQPLPFDAAARIWDLVICDGLHIVVLMSLANVSLLQSRLLKVETEGILELLSLNADGCPPLVCTLVQAARSLPPSCAPGLWKEGFACEHPQEAADLDRLAPELCMHRSAPIPGPRQAAELVPEPASALLGGTIANASPRQAAEAAPEIALLGTGLNVVAHESACVRHAETATAGFSPHIVGAEARVELVTRGGPRKPAALRTSSGRRSCPSVPTLAFPPAEPVSIASHLLF